MSIMTRNQFSYKTTGYLPGVLKIILSKCLLKNCPKMVDALYNISQWEVFLRILYNELIKSSKQIETLNNKLEEIYKQIQMAVQMRTAVPTRQVCSNF